jgi:hypoxanthine phosphoribosyltransferase
MRNDIENIYFTEEIIKERVQELGQQLTADYQDKSPLLISVLKGSFVFMADLVRSIDAYCSVEFISASSYGNSTTTSGEVRFSKEIKTDIEGRHVIIVEDILDTGITLNSLKNHLSSLKPASLKICTFLDKPSRRKAQVSADYVGFECPDAFFVGYGLDYAERYRNLPYIGSLKPEIYS